MVQDYIYVYMYETSYAIVYGFLPIKNFETISDDVHPILRNNQRPNRKRLYNNKTRI